MVLEFARGLTAARLMQGFQQCDTETAPETSRCRAHGRVARGACPWFVRATREARSAGVGFIGHGDYGNVHWRRIQLARPAVRCNHNAGWRRTESAASVDRRTEGTSLNQLGVKPIGGGQNPPLQHGRRLKRIPAPGAGQLERSQKAVSKSTAESWAYPQDKVPRRGRWVDNQPCPHQR